MVHGNLLAGALLAVFLGACGPDNAAHARRVLRETHAGEVKAVLREDISRHLRGVRKAGDKLARGFAVSDPALRGEQMRAALRLVSRPPRGVPELIGSARTFVAAIEPSGVVLATDAKREDDRMTSVDLGKAFKVVRAALAGEAGFAIDEFPALEKGAEGSVSLLFAAPSVRDGQVVGAVLAGIPLWRLAQRLGKQLQIDHVRERGVILWAYVLHAGKVHKFGTPPDLDSVLPTPKALEAALAKSPGGFTGELVQFGRWYAYGVLPLRVLGTNTAVLLVRSDPV